MSARHDNVVYGQHHRPAVCLFHNRTLREPSSRPGAAGHSLSDWRRRYAAHPDPGGPCQNARAAAQVGGPGANYPILVADKRDGQPLPSEQGPLRIVCPDDKEGARSVRMLQSLQVVQLRK